MRKTLSIVSSVAMSFFLTGCQNETLNSSSNDGSTELVSNSLAGNSSSITGTAVEISDRLQENNYDPSSDITQEFISETLAGLNIKGQESVTPELVQKTIEAGKTIQKDGIVSLCKNLGYSDYVARVMEKAEKMEDISSSIKDPEFSKLSAQEQDLIRNVISLSNDFSVYAADHGGITSKNNLMAAFGFGLGGALVGSMFGGAGAAVGYVIGFTAGLIFGWGDK